MRPEKLSEPGINASLQERCPPGLNGGSAERGPSRNWQLHFKSDNETPARPGALLGVRELPAIGIRARLQEELRVSREMLSTVEIGTERRQSRVEAFYEAQSLSPRGGCIGNSRSGLGGTQERMGRLRRILYGVATVARGGGRLRNGEKFVMFNGAVRDTPESCQEGRGGRGAERIRRWRGTHGTPGEEAGLAASSHRIKGVLRDGLKNSRLFRCP